METTSLNGGYVESAYSSNIPGNSRRKISLRRVGWSVGVLCAVALLVVLVVVGLKGDAAGHGDDWSNEELSEKLSRQVSDDKTLVLDNDALYTSSEGIREMFETLGEDHLVLHNTAVSLKEDKSAVVVKGECSMLNYNVLMTSEFSYIDKEGGLSAIVEGVAHDPVYLKDVVTDDVKELYGSVPDVGDGASFFLHSSDGGEFIRFPRTHSSLSLVSRMHLSGSEEFDYLSSMLDVQDTKVNIHTQIRPVTTPVNAAIPDFCVDKEKLICFHHVEVVFDPKDKKYSISATVEVKFKAEGIDPLTFDASGSLNGKNLHVEGELDGSWNIPGKVSGLELKECHIVIDRTDGVLSGEITGEVSYGEEAFGLKIQLPSPDTVAFGVVPSGVIHLNKMKCFPGDFPDTVVAKVALVFSTYDGSFDMSDLDNAPASSVQVVKGFNFFGKLDLEQNQETLGAVLALLSNPTSDGEIFIKGTVTKGGLFKAEADLTDISIGKSFEVTHAVLKFSSVSPYFVVSADMTLSDFPSTKTLTIHVDGTVSSDSISFFGKFDTDVTLNAGVNGIKLTEIAVQLTYVKSTKAISGSVTAVMLIDSMQLTTEIEYPAPGFPDCWLIEAEAKKSFSLSGIANDLVGNDGRSLPIADQLVDQLLNVNFSDVAVYVMPNCDNVTVTAIMSTKVFGTAEIELQVFKKDGHWQFNFVLIPLPSWIFESTGILPSALPHLDLKGSTWILSSTSNKVEFLRKDTDVSVEYDAKTGLNFFAKWTLPNTTTSSDLRLIKKLGGGISELDIKGLIGKDWYLEADIPKAKIDLGHRIVVLAAGVRIGAVSPYFSLHFEVDVKLDGQTITVSLSGSVGEDEITLKGETENTWTLRIGHVGMKVEELSVLINIPLKAGQVTGYLKGEVRDGPRTLINIEVDLMKDDLDITGSIVEDPPVTVYELLVHAFGQHFVDDIHLPSHFKKELLDVEFVGVSVSIDVEKGKFQADGSVIAFGDKLDCQLKFEKEDSLTDWKFDFGVAFADPFKFSKIIPSVLHMDSLQLDNPMLVFSSAKQTVVFPFIQSTYSVDPGVNFVASFIVQGKGYELIKKWTGVNELEIQGVFESIDDFTLRANFEGDFTLIPHIDVTSAGFFLHVTTSDLKFGLDIDMDIRLKDQTLDFDGDLYVSPLGVGFDAGMTTPWKHPLGVPGLTIDETEVSLELSYALAPLELGFRGGLDVGGVGGKAAVHLDLKDIMHSMLMGELYNIWLGTIVQHICGDFIEVPKVLEKTLFNVGFNDTTFYINLDPTPFVWAGKTYDPGFKFSIQGFNMYDVLKGSALMEIDMETGLDVNAHLDPIHFGDILTISGAKSPDDPVELMIKLHKGEIPSFFASGALDLFALRLASEVAFTDEEIEVYAQFKDGDLFNFLLNLTLDGTLKHPTDFSVLAEFNQEVLDYISKEIPKLVDSAVGDAEEHLKEIEKELEDKKSSVNGLKAKIKKLKDEDHRKLSKAEQDVVDAREKVEHAKAKVDGLKNKIDELKHKLHHCKWYQVAKKLAYEAAIIATEALKVAGDLVLDAANAILKLAEEALEKLPDVDPRVLALQAELGIEEAALDVAIELDKAVQDLLKGLDKVIDYIAKAIGEVFNIETAMMSGSYLKLKSGDLMDTELIGYFLGKHVSIHASLNLKDIEECVHNIWHALLKLL